MRRWKALLAWVAGAVFTIAVAPWLLEAAAAALLITDALAALARRRPAASPVFPGTDAVSVIIPTWMGRELLERNLPPLLHALSGNPRHEVLVVENGSNDGTSDLLASRFPTVRVVELGSNAGFGRACNIGCSMARNDIVVMLNNDMRVEPDFLEPLLEGFRDPRVFSVSGRIDLEDPARHPEETGLTMGRWQRGMLHLEHIDDEHVTGLFPTFYSGGGSTAFDRDKFMELGGFDELYEPFYVEDVDLSYQAWKRGWINFHAPGSRFRHQRRATIGRHFSGAYIERVVRRNRLLFAWKNLTDWGRLSGQFAWLYADLWLSLAGVRRPHGPTPRDLLTALARLPACLPRRVSAKRASEVSDSEAFRRPLGGYFRDRFHRLGHKDPAELNVLFVSPYPIEPPIHGGAVLMKQAVEGLADRCRLHLLCLTERHEDLETHRGLAESCASAEFRLHDPRKWRGPPLLWPHAAQAFWDPRLLWAIHRAILQREIDVVQLEYAQLASYAMSFRQVSCLLFEHDLHFQSVQRSLWSGGLLSVMGKSYEYLRALRFELTKLQKFDAVQVCSDEQRRKLAALLSPGPVLRSDLRTAIDAASYPFRTEGREPGTLLFVGNFRHPPNLQALEYLRSQILPRVRSVAPSARLLVAGADAPEWLGPSLSRERVEFLGHVADIRGVLARCAVFVAPILTGSGVRVKLLEAFASGIPVVATSLAAEGLCSEGSDMARVADRPDSFAENVAELLADQERARKMAVSARRAVERNWNRGSAADRLLAHYASVRDAKLLTPLAYPPPLL